MRGPQSQPHSILLSTRSEIVGGQRQRNYWERIVGLKEHLLCAACELRFSVYENYARTAFYGSGPGPSLAKGSLGVEIEPAPIGVAPRGFLGAHRAQFDFRLFKLFVLSLFWRASVAHGSFFHRVSLGPYEQRLAKLLLSENPEDENIFPFVVIDLRQESFGL